MRYHSSFRLVLILIACESSKQALDMDMEGFLYYSHQSILIHIMEIVVEALYHIARSTIYLTAKDLEIYFVSSLNRGEYILVFDILPGNTPKSGTLFNLLPAMLINCNGAVIGFERFCKMFS